MLVCRAISFKVFTELVFCGGYSLNRLYILFHMICYSIESIGKRRSFSFHVFDTNKSVRTIQNHFSYAIKPSKKFSFSKVSAKLKRKTESSVSEAANVFQCTDMKRKHFIFRCEQFASLIKPSGFTK